MKKNFGLVRIVVLLLCLSFLVSAFNMSAFAIDAGRATYMEKVTPAGMPFSFVLDTYDSDHANVSVASQVTSASVTLNIIKAGTKEAILPQNGVYELEYGVKYNFCYRYTESGFDYKYNGKVFAESSTGGQPSVLVENAVLNYIESGYANNRGIDSAGTTNESESNNTQATADTTYNDYDNYGSISTASDVDYWKVTFTHGGKANFWLGNIPSGNDYELEIYDSTGSYVDGSYNSSNTDELLSGINVTASTYYIYIYSYSGNSASNYWIRAKLYADIDDVVVYTIRNASTSTYLTIKNAANASNLTYAYAYLASSGSTDAQNNGQRMRVRYNNSYLAYNIAPLCSYNGYHRVLDVYGGFSSTDKRVWSYPNNGANEELFWFEKVGTDLYVISFANNSSYVLDMDASGNVVAKTRSGGTSQQWYVTKDTTYNSAETQYKGYNWSWPISNTSHTSAYGQRTLDGGASFNIHSGLDTAAPNGTSVYSPAAATYALAGYDTTYSCGYYLVIQANTYVYGSSTIKLKMLFQHLKEDARTTNSNLTTGYSITKNELIAKTGDTGSSGSYHLHYTAITDGSNVFVGGGYVTRTFTNTAQPLMFYADSFTYN